MTKIPRLLLLIISITTGFIALFIGGMLINQRTTLAFSALQPAEKLTDPFINEASRFPVTTGPDFPIQNSALLFEPTKTVQQDNAIPEITSPTPEWMTYDQLDLSDQKMKVTINLACENQAIVLPEFTVHAWYQGVFEDGTFDVSANSAIAWEHLGYYGLWMHSGQDILGRRLTAFNLHNYLERDLQGELRNPAEFDQHLQKCLVGSIVRLQAGGKTSLSRITAGARVPNEQINELSGHVMDLVPYLAEQYTGSGFSEIQTPGLLFYFCGRRLVGEVEDPNSFFWAQARIIIAMEPLPEDYFR